MSSPTNLDAFLERCRIDPTTAEAEFSKMVPSGVKAIAVVPFRERKSIMVTLLVGMEVVSMEIDTPGDCTRIWPDTKSTQDIACAISCRLKQTVEVPCE